MPRARTLCRSLSIAIMTMSLGSYAAKADDAHLDWGASQFLTKQIQVWLVGYVYKEIGCDSGSGDRVACFQSQVIGVGPQIGLIIPHGSMQGDLNVKGYREFAAVDRPAGWDVWATFMISPAAAAPPAPTRQLASQ
jgi:hypothetical protein